MTKQQRSPILPAALLAVGLAVGLGAGFGLGRTTAPSDLAELKGRIFDGGPSHTAPPQGAANDGEIIVTIGPDGRLAEEGLRFIEQAGKITLGARNEAQETVRLLVERENPAGSDDWEIIYSTRIEAGGDLAGTLSIPERSSARISVALESTPDTFSTALLTLWVQE